MEFNPVTCASTSKRSNTFSLKNWFPSLRTAAVSKLLTWKQCDEDDQWAAKALSVLAKKLKEKQGALEDLEYALSCPMVASKCVTIPRSLDGRVQVLHRKLLPHVIYCRIWRWPDLQSHHELQSIPDCPFAFSKKLGEVCINPYHYSRIKTPLLPPVMVSRHNDFVPGHSLLPFQQVNEPIVPRTVTYTPNGFSGLHSNSFDVDYAMIPQPQTSNFQPAAGSNNVIGDIDMDTEYQPSEFLLPLQSVAYEEQPFWASITYYELNTRVGETFNCKNSSIIVDGYTNPDKDGNRFCLGQLSNVNRNSSIERSRQHIGKGVHIYYYNGEVYVECLSNSSVFVQSRLTNHTHNFYSSTVCKVVPTGALKIFDNVEFSKLLSKGVNCSYKSVTELVTMCTIRLSFVKGWGAQYHRADATSTPAWIEIHLHGPLKWLDRVLTQMEGPKDYISSVS